MDEDKRGEFLQKSGKKHLIKSKRLIIFQIYTKLIFMLNFDIMYIFISYVLYVGLISSLNAEIEAINKFVLYNSKATQLWAALYEQNRMKWDSDRKEFRWLTGRSVSYPKHLKENMPKICPNSWVVGQFREKYGATGRYRCAEEDALNLGIGCSNSVIIFLIYM